MKKTLLNLGLFQLGWFVCVIGGNAYALGFTLFVLIIHGLTLIENKSEWLLILCVLLGGASWDFIMIKTGLLSFANPGLLVVPIWLVCLWILFSTTLNHGLVWLHRRLGLASLFGAIFGPASYWAGTRLSDAQLAEPLIISLSLMAVGWAVLFPAALYGARVIKHG